jgi:hypothetical protein
MGLRALEGGHEIAMSRTAGSVMDDLIIKATAAPGPTTL